MNGAPLYEETQGFGAGVYAAIAVLLVVVLALATLRLKTSVGVDSVKVSLGFLTTTTVPYRSITRAEAVVYRPIRDYGGWGIRGSGRKRAFNASGNQGVLITRTDGSTLLIGSQTPRALLSALKRAGVPTEDKLPPDIREF